MSYNSSITLGNNHLKIHPQEEILPKLFSMKTVVLKISLLNNNDEGDNDDDVAKKVMAMTNMTRMMMIWEIPLLAVIDGINDISRT